LASVLGVALHANQGEPVTGRVSDASNAPLAGATVTLQMIGRPQEVYTTKTDRDGIYQFTEVPDGNYSIEAGMRGHITVRYFPVRIRFPFGYERDFRLPADEVYVTDVADKAHVAGELRLADKPVGAARVCLRHRGEEVCTTTNRLGSTRFWCGRAAGRRSSPSGSTISFGGRTCRSPSPASIATRSRSGSSPARR
jgi:hypothetical protein